MSGSNTDRLRAVFCLNGPNALNGPNVWLTRHLPLLAERGIEPIVLYLSYATEQNCAFRDIIASHGLQVKPLVLGRFIEENALAIATAAAELKPDVFVPNYSVAAYYGARFLRDSGVTTVGTLHSDDEYYHDIVDVFLAGDQRWRLSAVVCVSEYLEALVRERLGPSFPSLHATYGAPVPTATSAWRGDRFRLVYAGRLVERQKRVNRVVDAMLAAVERDDRLEGVLFGEGPEQNQLEERLRDVSGRVRLGGYVAADQIQSAFLECQAFVLLSDFEGHSIALMEAMACGLVPIVTPMRSGVADLIEDGVSGLVVPADDPEAFADTIQRLAGDEELWSRMSRAARQAVRAKGYTAEACATAWSDFLANMRRSGSPTLPLVLPSFDEWEMPPRRRSPEGIRLEDRRLALPQVAWAARNGRPIYLWGASRAGEAFLRSVASRGLRFAGFIDADAQKKGTLFHGLKIFGPEALVAHSSTLPRPFVVITSQYEREIGDALRQLGMVEDIDYIAS